MQTTYTRSTISLGFFAIAALFFAIVAIWLVMVSNNNANLRQLDRGENQRQLVFAMRDAAHQRNLSLFRMAALQDAFARDSEYLRFKEAAGNFILARQQLLGQYLNKNTSEHWQNLKPLVRRSEKLQNAIVDLIMEDNNAAALSLIQQDFIPTQRRVSRQLSKMLDSARQDIADKLDTASNATQTHYQIILLLVLVATSIGYMIAKEVLRRNELAQNILRTKNQQIQALNDATSNPHSSIEAQIDKVLQLGCDYLSMESGLLIRNGQNTPATIINRHSQATISTGFDEEKLLAQLPELTNSPEIFATTASYVKESDLRLRHAMHETNISALVAVSVNTTSFIDYVAVFANSKNTALSDDTNELAPLLGNKLAALLDQQEILSQLSNARHAAETANKTKTVFLTNITDELQTPLHRIEYQYKTLQEKIQQRNHMEYADDLQVIQESSQQLSSLISNLLDITQLESGNMTVHRISVDIEPMLQNIEDILKPSFSSAENIFKIEILNDLGTIHSDSNRIQQVLVSLIGFANKLTHQGNISLIVWREPCPEDDWLYFEIKDTSNGISKKQLNHLFKMIISDSLDTDRAPVSPEIQLAISKRICELLGGDILVDSKPGHGTTFTVCIPCHSQQQQSITSMQA
ncbi:sensor histidine kinase [Kaarinaea lacus]